VLLAIPFAPYPSLFRHCARTRPNRLFDFPPFFTNPISVNCLHGFAPYSSAPRSLRAAPSASAIKGPSNFIAPDGDAAEATRTAMGRLPRHTSPLRGKRGQMDQAESRYRNLEKEPSRRLNRAEFSKANYLLFE
jgi:hypothetical protein